ncbi:MAG: replicative DNA helicase [Planctomycetota bacterium]
MATKPRTDRRADLSADRLPPHDLDAEMALLGSMMMNREAIGEVVPILHRSDASWFYLPAHQRLFEVLLDLYDDPTKAIDLIVVSDELRRRDWMELVGGPEYMVQLAESFGEWINAEHYARIVRDKGMLRDLIRCTREISEEAHNGLIDAREMLDRAEQKLFIVTERRVTGQAIAIRDAVNKLARQLDSAEREVCTGLSTGFLQLDEYTSGFQRGDFIVVAGRPSMGKTALGLNLARTAALDEHKPVVFYSMEMSIDQVTQRLVCAHADIDSQKLRRRMMSEEEINHLLHRCGDFHEAPLFIDDTPGMTPLELRAKARRLKQRHDIQAIYIDYLQLMHIPSSESRQVEISTISRQMKSLARELNIPIIAMAQLNRNPEGRADKKPQMSDLRESGAIEQDADVVLLIHRDEYYNPEKEELRGLAEIIIAKQRNGPTGNVPLVFDKRTSRFKQKFEGPEPHYNPRADDVPF